MVYLSLHLTKGKLTMISISKVNFDTFMSSEFLKGKITHKQNNESHGTVQMKTFGTFLNGMELISNVVHESCYISYYVDSALYGTSKLGVQK